MNESLTHLSLDVLVKVPGTEENISHDLLVEHGQTLTLPQVADLERLLIMDPGNPSVSSQLFGAYMHFLEVNGSTPTEDGSNSFCYHLLVEGRIPGTDKEIPNYPYFRNIRTLTRPQVAALERLLEAYPDSYPLRALLFDYYCLTFDRDGVSLTEDEMNACRTHYYPGMKVDHNSMVEAY